MTCGHRVGFTHLVLSSGARHGYFGHDEWAQWAPGLKTIEDARHIRSQLLLTFERAERTADPQERQRLMSIAIVGGGPTGVELAGAIAELSRYHVGARLSNFGSTGHAHQRWWSRARLLPGFFAHREFRLARRRG